MAAPCSAVRSHHKVATVHSRDRRRYDRPRLVMRGLHNLSGLVALAAVVTAFAAGAAASRDRSLPRRRLFLRQLGGMPRCRRCSCRCADPGRRWPLRPAAARRRRPVCGPHLGAERPKEDDWPDPVERARALQVGVHRRPAEARRSKQPVAWRIKRMRTYTRTTGDLGARTGAASSATERRLWLKIRLPMRPNKATLIGCRVARGAAADRAHVLPPLRRKASTPPSTPRRAARHRPGCASLEPPRQGDGVRERLVPSTGTASTSSHSLERVLGVTHRLAMLGVVGIWNEQPVDQAGSRTDVIRVRTGPMRGSEADAARHPDKDPLRCDHGRRRPPPGALGDLR